MIKLENEHYIRFILLLIKGGTEVLRETVTRGLKRQRVSLDDFLQTNKIKICCSKQITKSQRDILYPPSPHFTDISKWDISLLSHIALEYMSGELDGIEKLAVEKVRDMRNDVQAHSANAEIETRKFTNIWSELSLVITTLSHTMSTEDRVKLTTLISNLSSDQLDIYAAIEELKLIARRDDFFECIQTNLESIQQSHTQLAVAVSSCHQDVLQMKDAMGQGILDLKKELIELKINMENKGENTKIVNTMFGRVRVSAEEQCIVDTAETVLMSASVESVRKSEPPETLRNVKENVDRFVGDIEEIGVKVDSVEEGSIVFTFTCSSLAAVLDLIEYFQSINIQKRLDDIAKALENVVGKKVELTAYIPTEPLLDIIKKLGVEGLQHAWDVFEEGAASNSLNNLSKALTEAVGKPVRLETSIDVEQMQKAINFTKEQLDISSWENFAEKMEAVHLRDSGDEDIKRNTEEESTGTVSSDDDSSICDSEITEKRIEPPPILEPENPFPKERKKKRKKNKRKHKRDKQAKRRKLDDDGAHLSLEELENVKEVRVRDPSTGTKTYDTPEMVLGQGKMHDRNVDSENVNISSQSSLFKPDENTGTKTPNDDTSSLESDKKRQKITRIPIESTESTQTHNPDNDGYDVDTEWNMQTRSKTKENMATQNNEPGYMKNTPVTFESEEKSTQDSYQPLSSVNIRVYFHIILPPEFKFNSAVDKVVLRIGNAMFGGWNSNEHVMHPECMYPSGHTTLSYILDIPKLLIAGKDRILEYKYFVIRNTKTRHQVGRKNLWDHYFINGHAGAYINRKLQVPEEWKSNAHWHQFDAVVNRKPKDGVVSWIRDYMSRRSKLRDDATLAVQIYRDWIFQSFRSDASPSDISRVFEFIELMMHGLRRVYVTDGKCFDSEEEMLSILGLHVLEPMEHSFDEVDRMKTNETTAQWQWRMTVQFALLVVLKKLKAFDWSKNDRGIYTRLCTAFLVQTDPDKKTCKELEFLRLHFPKQLKGFKEAFVMLGKAVVKQRKDPTWLYIMPMVHFLSEVCQPYQPVTGDATHTANVPVWWGTSHIGEDTTKQFKKYQNDSWVIPLHVVLKNLQPLFEIDYLLPRTFIASLNLYEVFESLETRLIPTEVCCASLTYYVRTTRPKYWYGKSASDEEKFVCKCIQIVLTQLSEECQNPSNCGDSTKLKMAATVSLDLAVEALYFKSNRNQIASASLGVYVLCASRYQLCLKMQKNTQSEQERNIANIRHICETAITWLNKHWSIWTNLDVCLEIWDSFMIHYGKVHEQIEEIWNKSMTDALESSLSYFVEGKRSCTETFVKFYCQKVDAFHPKIQLCLEQIAFKAIDRSYVLEIGYLGEKERGKFGDLLSKMFDTEFKNILQRATSVKTKEFLRQILKWTPILQFMKIFCTVLQHTAVNHLVQHHFNHSDLKKLLYVFGAREVCRRRIYREYNVQVSKQQMGLLNDECKLNLMKVITVLDTRVDEILNGTITVGDLLLFHNNAEQIAEIAELIKETETEKEKFFSKQRVRTAIEIRKKELDAFLSKAELIVTLAFLCKKLTKVDVSDLDRVLEKRGNIEEYRLKEFCEPALIKEVKNITKFKPTVTAFNIPTQIETILPRMHVYQKSSVFMKLWDTQCDQNSDNCATLDDIVRIWQRVSESWEDLSHKIETGKILFREFEHLIGHMFREDYTMVAEELRALTVSEKVREKRIDQLKKYRHLETCRKGAKALLKFKQEYQLVGDFEQIKLIAGEAESKLKMEEFDDSLIVAFEFLKDFTTKRANCLNTFLKCQHLVQWLKESMHTSGLKELQVFVDLALMSIGDDPYNIGKVQALHSAVTGYAPLIFDLKKQCGYMELLELCKLVWRELDVNSKLPKQLEDTNFQLDWLKEIKEAHGSIEVTSMMQMEAINSDGTFTVGRRAFDRHGKAKLLDVNVLTVEDTIQVTVPEEKGKRQLRKYTFSQLQDLQSRLMLVAGKAEKGTDNVERFTMIFDSVSRLSKFFVKLHSSGCVLFKEWSARFICDPDPRRPVCTVIDFGQSEEVPQLKGRTAVKEDLKDMVPEIVRFMETCHDEWLEHIKEKRKSYLFLNYFTVDQLVILQRELVKFGTDLEPSHLMYPLLSAVKPDCTEDDILQALSSAKEEVDRKDHMEIDNNEDTLSGLERTEDLDDTKRQTFIRNLVDAGQEEAMAIRALENVDPEDFSQGILWCMEHADSDMSDDEEMDVETTTSAGLPTKQPFQGWSQSEISVQSLIERNLSGLSQHSEVGVKHLINNLEQLWRQFLESISSNVKDYLSLEHLGIILGHLATRNSKIINRSLPPGFKEGVPNLVVCPSDDVLPTALSIYMGSKDQPLPQSDELLLCTSGSTIDEVDIFWRRALFESSGKIHCLLNAEFLTYEVSEASERRLQDYLLQTYHRNDTNYRLCIICGSDRKNHSGTMVSFLDKFQRQAPLVNMYKLREYVAKKLASDKEYCDRSAAVVDKERSTVRVIKSWRPGVGKSLFKNRREKELLCLKKDKVKTESVTIPLQEKNVDIHCVIERLLDHTLKPTERAKRLFHVDISHEVQEGVDYLLFNLLILGCLTDRTGYVWRKSDSDLYLIETMPLLIRSENEQDSGLHYLHTMLTVLPDITCRSPRECVLIYSGTRLQDQKDSDQLFDEEKFKSEIYQRPFQYLLRLTESRKMDDVRADRPEGTSQSCLEVLLRYCGIKDPSWAELHHFVWFLNTQLYDFTKNNFVSTAAEEDLPGFSTFVLKFLIQMSKDFSTSSLNISEESPGLQLQHEERIQLKNIQDENTDIVQLYQMRRTWESSPHPYLFFNWDKMAFTFLGFNIEKSSGNLIDQQTGHVLEQGIMKPNLYEALERNHAPLQENFNSLQRDDKIKKLRAILGVESSDDPDTTYELTTDNVKKIMAIYMRFRCNIPVIIMGETGCGKTRLVKFMCKLQVPKKAKVENMILMKVHGGTTTKDIIKRVKKAETLAKKNKRKYGDRMYTVLFFDEANSSEAIGLIKEIMCDKRIMGERLQLCENLKIVAACNPYRKHSEQLIKKLEMAGLGYHVDAEDTTDRFGRVPMRRLVYRVQPLPRSLLPLVWDFGQLNTLVETLYIQQMVKRYIDAGHLPNIRGLKEVTSEILAKSQEYMRLQKDECSFVSLRDVERVLTVMSWFYSQNDEERMLYNLMDEKLYGNDDANTDEAMKGGVQQKGNRFDDITRSLVLALGVCYHACLKTRKQYRRFISRCFKPPCQLARGKDKIFEEIDCCQDVFLDHVDLEKNIARNMALKENVFMMVVCIELRIPLFLIGKPGSSKSLAKTIVSDAMRGNAAKQKLFKRMKQAKMVSYQCSPISTPGGIVGTFNQCAQFQKDKDLSTFASVVVLDEVGLAEDSPRMPLKTLHPLLEDGCQGDEDPQDYMKVAFIGISNWALDPAKMNRGIVVQREVPDLEELINSARGICKTGTDLDNRMEPLIKPMALSYLELFDTASKGMREFFGLRDFYSLVKMVFRFVEKSSKIPTWYQMLHAVKRNFGGLDQVNPVESFRRRLSKIISVDNYPKPGDPDCSAAGLIRACLFDTNDMQSESRYLLLLTENYGALTIIQQLIQERSEDIRPITIFGSSFRSDQEYTQVCRNINKIKVCMETGNTVVLLNLENLYESLYDALNQYYVYFGDVRYVDLGLGTHRVKCPVHPNFRLIVVAEKQTVYKKFPIPLINRLEKHFLTINTMLSDDQLRLVSELEKWAKRFASQRKTMVLQRDQSTETKVGDVFIGYHDDSCSAIILYVWQKHTQSTGIPDEEKILHEAKCVLLWCATPDALVRLERSMLPRDEQDMLCRTYRDEQTHNNVLDYLIYVMYRKKCKQVFAQITTHSKLLSTIHAKEISLVSKIDRENILLIETLSSFDTEQQFSNRIRQHICMGTSAKMILIQCEHGDTNASLIASARYCVMDEFEKLRDEMKGPVHVIFILQLPKVAGGCFTGFQCGTWHSVHVDDLLPEDMDLPTVQEMHEKSVGMLIGSAIPGQVMMETDECVKIKSPDEEDMEWKEDISTESGHPFDKTSMPMSHQNVRKDDLQLEDILFDLKNVEYTEGGSATKASARAKLNVKKLILSCVQSALAMVKDKNEQENRETDRVDLVIKLLHQDQMEGQPTFMQGICMLIAKLLQEKETTPGAAHNARQWLVNEAAKLENINKAGTFRSSCIKVLESRIFPILAGIVAYCDTNENLTILDETQFPWKHDIWLSILNTPGAITLQYKDFQSPTRSNELEEVTVMSTGCEEHAFSARMPFSWLFIDKFIEVLKLDHPTDEVSEDSDINKRNQRAESCIRVLRKHPLCQIYDGIKADPIIHDASAEYIWDLVRSMYPAETEDEFNLVFESVTCMALQLRNGTQNDSLLTSVVYIHLAFETLTTRFTYYRMLNVVWPECSAAILKLKAENPDHYMFKENEMTFSAVCLLVENISPKKSQLDTETGRSKWLNNVHRYRAIVEKVISLYDEDPTQYGASAAQIVRRIKALWSRVLVMKLFIEHVCVSDSENRITVKFCTPLWSLLGEEADMKRKESLNAVEKFLKTCNKGAMKEYLGSVVKCSDCEKVLEGAPVTLPCKDVLCDRCYNDLIAARNNTCAKCRKTFADNWAPETNVASSHAEEKLKDYQKRCNAFFMDVVSQLSFADKTPPTDDVVEKLLKYAFCETRAKRQHTKDLSIFDTGIDPNPVFRSFLLQLLLQTSEKKVIENLEKYLKEAEAVVSDKISEKEQMYIKLSLLVISCVEDKLMQKDFTKDSDDIEYAVNALETAIKTIDAQGLTVQKLYGLASARVGLAVVAHHIAKVVTQGPKLRTMIRLQLVDSAKNLCTKATTDWPKKYLVKYLCRFYGTDVYQKACDCKLADLRWMATMDMNKIVSDRYIVCGKNYTELREALSKTLLGGNIDILQKTMLKKQKQDTETEPMLQLAIYREVTSRQKSKLTTKVLKKLKTFITGCDTLKNKKMLLKLMENKLVPSKLGLVEAEDVRVQGIQCLIVHFLIVMTHLKANRTLLQPLLTMIVKPRTCRGSFLPTMPQDDLEDVKEALIASRNTVKSADQTAVFYRCPNGHPYVIGDCGKAYVKAKCQCGAEIGGQAHKLLETNTLDTAKDQTMTGHILGRTTARGSGPKPERQMTPAQCAVIRLLVHMSMYLGIGSNIQGIQKTIKPNIEVDQVEDFLWQHIQLDVDDIHRGLTKSVDDVLLFMHCVIHEIMSTHDPGHTVQDDVYLWSSKRGRRDWEFAFVSRYLPNTFKNMESLIQNNNKALVNDTRLGSDPLLCLLYETDALTESSSKLQDVASVWRYRTPVSIQHLRQSLEAEIGSTKVVQRKYNALQLFLTEEYHLRALRFVPSILRLQRMLIQKYQKKLDKAEASQITVAKLRKDKVAGSETSELLSDYAEAWEMSREALRFYLCTTEAGGATIPNGYCSRSINDDTPVSMLLPAIEGEGLCSYVLLDFLMRKQNDFLDKYMKETGRKSDITAKVFPKDVTAAHLICYDPQHDLLTLVLANCQYTFKLGEGTSIEYDYSGLERQLMDRFLFSKSRIDIGPVLQIDMMIYRTEFTNASVFKKLSAYIKQETINSSLKKQICNNMKSLPDICKDLYNLDITISFLRSTGGLPEQNLHKYMKKTLQMETTFTSSKAQQMCQFKHVQSLWSLLALQKSKTMTDNQHQRTHTFESVQPIFDVDLSDEELETFNNYMRNLSEDKLSSLIEVLHEFILLKIAVKQNTDDEDYTDITENLKHLQYSSLLSYGQLLAVVWTALVKSNNHTKLALLRRMTDWLVAYIEEKETPPLDVVILEEFPKAIKLKHSIHTWIVAYKMLKEKQSGAYSKY